MRRGDVLIAVNFGEEPAEVSVGGTWTWCSVRRATRRSPTVCCTFLHTLGSCSLRSAAGARLAGLVSSVRSLRALLDHLWLRPVPLGSGG